jgi:hypothetical protein
MHIYTKRLVYTNFVPCDQICVARLKLKGFNLCCAEEFCVVRLKLCGLYTYIPLKRNKCLFFLIRGRFLQIKSSTRAEGFVQFTNKNISLAFVTNSTPI